MPTTIPYFDGHNDTIMRIRTGKTDFYGGSDGHIDLPKAKRGGMASGFFAVWVPDASVAVTPGASVSALYSDPASAPPMMTTEYAQNYALASLGLLINLPDASNGDVVIVTTVAELQAAIAAGKFAIELHLEGAEPIDANLDALAVWYAAGIRSIGPVWSRKNLFAQGVPFTFGQTPDSGPGLTDAGRALVKACNELGIMLDLSHLNEAGFWDIAKLSDDPLVATHSCAWSIANSPRNLTDKQLDAIKESNGVVGLNYSCGFLDPQGRRDPAAVTVGTMADHIDYMVNRMGIDHVALGSDFDGTLVCNDITDCSGVPKLFTELTSRGYDAASLTKIGTENWIRVLGDTWK